MKQLIATLATVAALSCAVPLHAQEPTKLTRVRLSYPTYTLNETILFESAAGGNWDIFEMPGAGMPDGESMFRRLTSSDSLDRMPAMSPDGRYIAFISTRDGNHDVFRMNADGSNVVRLTTSAEAEIHPYWSPDSRQIIFNRRVAGEPVYAIWIMNADGSRSTELLRDRELNSYAQMSPDGRHIVFDKWWNNDETNGEIMVMDLDSRGLTRLTSNTVYDGYPTWFPDSRSIVYSSEVDGAFKLFRISINGGEREQLTFGPGSDQRADVSVDGTRVVFNRNINDTIEIYELMLGSVIP